MRNSIQSLFSSVFLVIFVLTLPGHSQSRDGEKPKQSFPLVVRSTAPKKNPLRALVVDVKGVGSRYLNDGKTIKLAPGRLIPTKGAFVIPKESQVVFRPMPSVNTLIEGDSNLQMKGLQVVKRRDKIVRRRSLLYLNEGGVFSSISKFNKSTTAYQIQTPQALISAKGTRFLVRFRGTSGKVGVLNGVVTVRLADKTIRTLKQGDWVDIEGTGLGAKMGEIRLPLPQEVTDSERLAQEISRVEGVTSSSVNPFLLTPQQAVDELEKDSTPVTQGVDKNLINEATDSTTIVEIPASPSPSPSPNPDNTSTNPVVSPVVP